jgi:hypothetical protein
MKKGIWAVVACSVVLWTATAQGASGEEKCLAGRLKAKGKYEQCVEKTRAKIGGGIGGDVRKCLEKYTATWAKLQTLVDSATCSGQPRFTDNGTTVADNLTGLIWEKKTDDNTVHDKDNMYSWTSSDGDTTDEDGTAFTTFLTGLNAGVGFAGANGWRLPTFAELSTIRTTQESCGSSGPPCIDPTFGPTASSSYWSATTASSNLGLALNVPFDLSSSLGTSKSQAEFVRAVRGGL